MRIVLDSNILVRSFVKSQGLARELLLAILSGEHTLILSHEILYEVARVLRYPRLMMVHGQNEEAIYNYTDWLRDAAEIIALNPLQLAPIRDRHDIFVLQTALNGETDVLCTGDRDFFEPPASIFLAGVGITVLTDVQLMRRLKG
ncbi:MAG: putative toxin-antitoxin system toxin component, PIN family [Terracidiphilus sp.]